MQRDVLVTQGQQAARLDPDDRHAPLGERGQPGRHPRGQLAGLVQQAFRDACPAAAAALLDAHPPAGQLQQLDRRDRDGRFGPGGERVGQEHDLAERERAVGRATAGQPAQQGVAPKARQGPGRGDAEHPLGERPRQPRAPRQVGQRRQRRAQRVQPPDGREQPGPRRHAVQVMADGKRLGLEGRHVHPERALALAGLALQAQVEDPVQAVVSERCLRVRRRKGHDQRVGPSSRGMLLVAGGHVGRAHDATGRLAAEPDVHAAVGRGTHALSAKLSRVATAGAGSMAGSRRCSVMAGRRRSCLGSCGRPGRTGA